MVGKESLEHEHYQRRRDDEMLSKKFSLFMYELDIWAMSKEGDIKYIFKLSVFIFLKKI